MILSDTAKRNEYDAGSDLLFARATATAQWVHFVKPLNNNDVDNARKKYQNSNEEKYDILREYHAGNGSMTHLLNNVPFMRIEDEPRIICIINELVKMGRAKKMKIKKISKK